MDTREKIVSPDSLPALLASGDWVAVTGVFDPLTVTQARRIAACARKCDRVLAIVLKGIDTLLEADERAVLMAALRAVDAVVVSESHDWRRMIPSGARVEIVDDPDGERARSAAFRESIMRSAQTIAATPARK